MKFRGTICTDGVGVSVLKQSYDTKKKGGSSGGKLKSIEADEFQYVKKLGKEALLAGIGKCILIDPSRRDLLYCMKLKNHLKKDKVIVAELSLSYFKSSTVNKDRFVDYLQERGKVTPVMKAYYLKKDRPAEEDQRAGGCLPFRKMKLSSFINQQLADKRLA
ncbi:hypothetical protein G6F37_005264 [Rhizopus arrhizus]|nr:hypothetical protein G6F38_005403 [Rhizopus arrhizus]KAG1159031.1 hypothetical protein G6F37_005264 [Rhizopus arrhizus]